MMPSYGPTVLPGFKTMRLDLAQVERELDEFADLLAGHTIP